MYISKYHVKYVLKTKNILDTHIKNPSFLKTTNM